MKDNILFPDWYQEQLKKKADGAKKDRRQRRKNPPVRYPITERQANALKSLSHCTFMPGTYDKRFVRDLQNAIELTERQGVEVARLVYRYRRQLKLTPDRAKSWRIALEADARRTT